MKNIKIFMVSIFILLAAANVKAQQSLKLACDEWAPYQIVENNEVSGFSTEIVRAVLKNMGISVSSVKAYPWERALMMIKKGYADALFSANFSEERSAFAYYPKEAIIESPWVMWIREKSGLKFDSYNDLKGKKIGLVRGYSYTPEFWAFMKSNKDAEEATYDESNFRKLSAGRIDYAVAELGNGYYLIQKMKLTGIAPLKENPIKSDGLYIIFSKNNVSKHFVEKFSEELKTFKKSDGYQKLYRQYVITK